MSENNKKYKLVIAYDGTEYAGWQVQKNQKSIANIIENRFYAVFKKKIHLVGASRTDAGVHAYGQVATFEIDLDIDSQKMRRALQKSLPASFVIRILEPTSSSFNPRYDVVQKIYWYHFFCQEPMPWVSRYGYYIASEIDHALLQEALALFVGTHDFRSFCSGDSTTNTVRTIDSICIEFNEQLGSYKIVVKGKGFLRYMIRRIVGACFQVALKEKSKEELMFALDQKDSRQLLRTAPAHGLMLYEIIY